LADDDRAGVLQGLHAGRITRRAGSRECSVAEAGRKIPGLDDVFDSDRTAVEIGERSPGALARRCLIGGCTRSLQIERHECLHDGFAGLDGLEAALEELARAVLPIKDFATRLLK